MKRRSFLQVLFGAPVAAAAAVAVAQIPVKPAVPLMAPEPLCGAFACLSCSASPCMNWHPQL